MNLTVVVMVMVMAMAMLIKRALTKFNVTHHFFIKLLIRDLTQRDIGTFWFKRHTLDANIHLTLTLDIPYILELFPHGWPIC